MRYLRWTVRQSPIPSEAAIFDFVAAFISPIIMRGQLTCYQTLRQQCLSQAYSIYCSVINFLQLLSTMQMGSETSNVASNFHSLVKIFASHRTTSEDVSLYLYVILCFQQLIENQIAHTRTNLVLVRDGTEKFLFL